MKKFLSKGLIFFGIVMTLNVLVAAVVHRYYYSLYRYDISELRTYHTFLFADSHGLALDSHLASHGIYNFSAGSESYIDIHRKIKFLTSNNVSVKRIILSVDDHTLSVYREQLNNQDRSITLISPFDEFELRYFSYYELLKLRIIYPYFSLLNPKARDVLKATVPDLLKRKNNSNKQTESLVDTWLKVKNKVRMSERRVQRQFPNEKGSAKLEDYLLEILSHCHEKKIDVTGIKFPLTKEYVVAQGEKSYHADQLLVKRNYNILDFRTTFVDSVRYFKNQDHLNETGGKKLCKLILSHLDKKPSQRQVTYVY